MPATCNFLPKSFRIMNEDFEVGDGGNKFGNYIR